MAESNEVRRDVTDDDIGKPIFTAEEHKIGTLQGIESATLYISLAEEMDSELHSDIKIAETTAHKHNDEYLAAATRASVEDVTDDEIHFWPTYATEAEHESVSYTDIPAENSDENPEE
jgi:hypothetical protein